MCHDMAVVPLAKLPEPLNLVDPTHRGENWQQFKRDWKYYKMALKMNKEESPI